MIEAAKDIAPQLNLRVEFSRKSFEEFYPDIEKLLAELRIQNVLFNLDQCGTSLVSRDTMFRIMRLAGSVEIFYTFMIDTLLAFLKATDPVGLANQLAPFGIDNRKLEELSGPMSKRQWLGAAERIVFDAFRDYAPFHSPFSINNPDGWRYWLIHFSTNYRARQVYNQILHMNASSQAHFGRSGLNMLSYDPEKEGEVYFFDDADRTRAKEQLYDDIPSWISASGDAIPVVEFYQNAYNDTPAHADDIHEAIIANPDVQVLTPNGGLRRSASSIAVGDTLRLAAQPSFNIFGPGSKPTRNR